MHQGFLKRSGALALLGLSLAGCSEAADPLAGEQQRVIGGQDTGFDHAGVVFVTSEVGTVAGSTYFKVGSGSIVAPNLLLTALHVISRNPSDVPFSCDDAGNEVSSSNGSLLGPTIAAEKISVFGGPVPGLEPLARGTTIVSSGSPTICKNDIAFVVLDTEVDLPPYPIHRGGKAVVGEDVTVVGYGTEQEMDATARTERDVRVTAVGQWIRTFTVGIGPCEGDSGGPALNADGEIAGVFSTVAVDCKNANAAPKYTDVSYFGSLIDEAFEAAGVPIPGAGGQPDGAGGGATAGEPSVPAEAGSGGAGEPPAEAPPEPDDSGCSLQSPPTRPTSAAFLMILVGAWFAYRRRH
jgi:V8-like Glu-specific endopeptidase